MNIYELNAGDGFIRRFIAAKDAEEARKIGEDPAQHPDLCFRPFEVIPVTVEGYVITVKPEKK